MQNCKGHKVIDVFSIFGLEDWMHVGPVTKEHEDFL